jgi:hypothetical protein
MNPGARPLTLAVLGIAGVDLWLGLGASRLGLGLAAALSLAGPLVAREFWHG